MSTHYEIPSWWAYKTMADIIREYPDRELREDYLNFHEHYFGVKLRKPRPTIDEMMEAERLHYAKCGVPWTPWEQPEPQPERPDDVDEVIDCTEAEPLPRPYPKSQEDL